MKGLTIAMLSVMGVLCAIAALGFFFIGRPGMALAFAGYVLANGGFIIEAISKP